MPSTLSLLCLPCAGASATMYLRWRRLLPRWVEVVPVELPGRGGRLAEAFADDFEVLVERLCIEQAAVLQQPYALFGHSMGALLAHAMARRQQAQGGPLPAALVISASPAPSRRDTARFAALTDDESLVAELRRQGGTPDEVFVSPELMRLTLDILAADYRLCSGFRYRPAPALRLPVHALAGRHDSIAAEHVAAWAEETAGHFTLDRFDGGHFFIRQHEPQVLDLLAARLAASLAVVCAGVVT
jgi:surfactin synthase thioesterase subunit